MSEDWAGYFDRNNEPDVEVAEPAEPLAPRHQQVTKQIHITPTMWLALKTLGTMRGTSASEEVRQAASDRVRQYGLTVTDEHVELPDGTRLYPPARQPRKG